MENVIGVYFKPVIYSVSIVTLVLIGLVVLIAIVCAKRKKNNR